MASGRSSWFTRRRTVTAVVVVVLCGAGIGTWLATSNSGASPLVTTTTSLQTVTTGTITKTVASSGSLEPASQADLNFAVAGRVNAVSISAGQTVAAGQVLATLDTTSLAASLTQAQASLANDQAQLVTDQGDGASAAQIASDNAAVASAQTQVTAAQTSVGDATLTSPIAGTVATVSLAVGQEVTGSASSAGTGNGSNGSSSGAGSGSGTGSSAGSGSSSGSGSPSSSSNSSSTTAQVVVVSTGSYVVNATVDSSQVGQVTTGDQAVITVSGSMTPIYGTVASVGLLASTTSGVAAFPVVVNVTGSPAGLYGGSSATVSIITEELYDVVVVPTAAIHYSGNGTTVLIDSGGSKVSRTVSIGASSGGQTQVTSGLSVGDKVYVTEISFRGVPGGTGRAGLFGRSGAGGFGGGGGGVGGGGGGGFPAGGFGGTNGQ